MRKFFWRTIVTIFMFVVLLPAQAFAESNDEFLLNEAGTVTLVSAHAAKEGVSSLQFELLVDAKDADKIEFQFRENHAKVAEARFHQDTKTLTVYLAGTDALFAEDTNTLVIGNVIVLDKNGENVTATVSVVEDSLWYVYGTEMKKAEGLTLPGAVVIGSDEEQEPQNPDDGSQGGNGEGGTENGSQEGTGGTNETGGVSQTGSTSTGNGSTAADGKTGLNMNVKSPNTTDGDVPGVIENGSGPSDFDGIQITTGLQETEGVSAAKIWAVLAVTALILIFAAFVVIFVIKQRGYEKRR